jgi:hypothetical protein
LRGTTSKRAGIAGDAPEKMPEVIFGAGRVDAHAGIFKRQRIAICHPVMVEYLISMHQYKAEYIEETRDGKDL